MSPSVAGLVRDLYELGWNRFTDDGHGNRCRYCDKLWADVDGHEPDCLWPRIEKLHVGTGGGTG